MRLNELDDIRRNLMARFESIEVQIRSGHALSQGMTELGELKSRVNNFLINNQDALVDECDCGDNLDHYEPKHLRKEDAPSRLIEAKGYQPRKWYSNDEGETRWYAQ